MKHKLFYNLPSNEAVQLHIQLRKFCQHGAVLKTRKKKDSTLNVTISFDDEKLRDEFGTLWASLTTDNTRVPNQIDTVSY